MTDETKLAEYWSWVHRTGNQTHDVGFHVDPEGWRTALIWALSEIADLQLELRAKEARTKELELTVRHMEENG